MANRRPIGNMNRRMDSPRFNDRNRSLPPRAGVSPWQAGSSIPNLLPLGGASTEATLALANNLISNLLQSRQNTVPSLLDMPIRRDFIPDMGRPFDRGFNNNRMGNQASFRRATGMYNRAGERINTNRRPPGRPNDGPRKQTTPRKDDKSADSKAKPIKTESTEGEGDKEKTGETEGTEAVTSTETAEVKTESKPEAAGKGTRFEGIEATLLHCHICNKTMWDGRSFENHINGRAHSIMMQKTAESYALTADTMRQEFKIRESKRMRRSGGPGPRDFYCAMCDLYAADGAVHRTTLGHRKLKKYLHPACTSCHKEMPTRIELDEHRLSLEHLLVMQAKQKEVVVKPKPEVMVISTLSTEQSYVREDLGRKKPIKAEGDATASEDKDNVEVKKEVDEEMKEDKSMQLDDNVILDYKEGDDLTNITKEMLPDYCTERGVGRSFLSPFSCWQCRLCRKLLDSEETAEVHLRTWRHHQLYVRSLQDKCKKENTDASKRTANSHDDDDDGGNWKRRKTTGATADGDGDADRDGDVSADANGDVNMKEEAQNGDEDAGNENENGNENDTGTGNENENEKSEEWEKTVDEIIMDEARPEDAKAASPEPAAAKPAVRGTPRGRGRGGPRGRRR